MIVEHRLYFAADLVHHEGIALPERSSLDEHRPQ